MIQKQNHMISFDALQKKEAAIAVVGLGYVGLPLAILLAKHFSVIGFDISEDRIAELKNGIDRTKEVPADTLTETTIMFTPDPDALKDAQFIIVAVPTPIDAKKKPDMRMVHAATRTVGKALQPGSIVVYESTVYPGATEEECVPILEEESGLRHGADFTVGYSPERVNPGDTVHTIDKVMKIVSGTDAQTLECVAQVYGAITTVHKASSIKVAEAAKVIENTQRDLNIALMNELAVIFKKMNIPTYDVLEAAGTKWNFLPFTPGLVGGHCIGVDPYYLTYKAQTDFGYRPQVILAGRGINDAMHEFIAEELKKELAALGKKKPKQWTVAMLGITFKENIPDVRNSKAAELVQLLQSWGASVFIADPHAHADVLKHEYGLSLTPIPELPKADCVIVAVVHDAFRSIAPSSFRAMMKDDACLLADMKQVYAKEAIEKEGVYYWSL